MVSNASVIRVSRENFVSIIHKSVSVNLVEMGVPAKMELPLSSVIACRNGPGLQM